MSRRSTVATLAFASVLAAGCGKSTKDQPSSVEPKVAEGGTTPPMPGSPAVAKSPTGAKTGDAKVTPPAKAPSRGPERSVYSLVDNRLSAHLTRGGGLFVPAGSAAMAKYIRFGNQMGKDAKDGKAWSLRQTEGEIKVARKNGKTASVFVPLTAAQAASGKVRIRLYSPEVGALTLGVNGKDHNVELAQGWSTLEVDTGKLQEGENTLSLFSKPSELAIAWMQIGGERPVPDDASTAFFDLGKKALTIPQDAAMSYYVVVPDKAKLTGDLSNGSCTVDVVATAEDGSSAAGKLTGIGAAVDLGALAGKAARLDLAGTGCAVSELSNAALVLPGAAPEIKRAAPPKHVVFVIMDSLRADHVRPWNAEARADVPNFDKLAETGTIFLQNYVQGNESQVSHASMWTSMYLAKHKSPNMKDVLADRYVTIDEVAKKAGMFTAGVSANGYIRPKRGYGSSWDKFVNHIESSMGLKGVDVLDKGMSFVTPKKEQPWFLYLGLIDTHVTLRGKAPWIEKYAPGYKGRFEKGFGDDGPGGVAKDLTEKEKDFVKALYDSNVSYQDDLLGKLIKQLEEWGIRDETMLIVTADHGDELWEDGRFGHGGSVRETLTHVPLLIHYPPLFPAGKVTEGTDGIDIVPTLADALGVAHDPEWQGMSLLPIAHGHGGYPLMSFASRYEIGHAGRIGHWKAILKSAAAPSIYNLAKDRGEQKDLYGTAHIGTRVVLDPMWIQRTWNVEWKKSQWGNAASVSNRFAADLGE